MKALIVVCMLLAACTAPSKTITVSFTDTVTLDKDAVLVCPFLVQYNAMRCMTMEEYIIRSEPKDP
jgi:uncharacterized lipoprotein YajG